MRCGGGIRSGSAMKHKWWETAVFYQVYPRSFADGNGDGIGDFPGLIDNLDYLQWLGVGAVWLSPHYPSPQVDIGYDIADYTGIEPAYGTMRDFDRLLDEIHRRGMKLILDLVLNHTSDRHAWFRESRADRDNPKRDWYIWRDGVSGGPPNNWQSEFGGSAWEYNDTTGQWYYHDFLKEQPDLNWRNPEVKAAMFDAARFWLDKGVDGFRLDAIGTLFEDPDLTPHSSRFTAIDALRHNWLPDETRDGLRYMDIVRDLLKYQHELPEVFELMRDFRSVIDAYDDRFLVGETSDIRFLGDGTNGLHAVFNFDLVSLPELTANRLRSIREAWRSSAPGGTRVCNTLNNHDQSRAATHFVHGDHAAQRCRTAIATVLLFLEGIPFLYYGEEIGMRDYALRSLEEMRDRVGWVYRDLRLTDGIGETQILKELGRFSRDRCRTPMQWDRSANAGFSPAGVRTWLPVHTNHQEGVNVADEQDDPHSLLHFYRKLIGVRNAHAALQTGTFRDLDPTNEHALVFLRESPGQCCLVAINFSPEPVAFASSSPGRILYTDGGHGDIMEAGRHTLAPFDILVAELVPVTA